MLDDSNVGNLIIEARKQHPDIPAHVIHDAILANQVKVRSGGAIELPKSVYYNNGNTSY